jgi:hypothetical protein
LAPWYLEYPKSTVKAILLASTLFEKWKKSPRTRAGTKRMIIIIVKQLQKGRG